MSTARKLKLRMCMPFFLILFLLASATYAADSCILRVNDVSGLDSPWPLVGGLPLPEGKVYDANCIRIMDEKGSLVNAQVDVAAKYRDGSIRWALLSFTGSTKCEYRAEFGNMVAGDDRKGIIISEKNGISEINTGPALFTLSDNNLLMESAALLGTEKIPLWNKGENAAYLIDNQGRTAKCQGAKAEIKRSVLKSGSQRLVIRSEGWYVTENGERLAKGVARMSFFSGSAMVQISHTLIFTEDTNKIWIRDYGIDVPFRAGTIRNATFDVSKAFDETVRKVELKVGDSVSMLQDDFPHFLETGSHFSLSHSSGGKTQELMSGIACGEWCDLSSETAGMTVVIQDLAEQFPKELEATGNGIRVHFWPVRCGREWDFRAPTLLKEYWGRWIENGIWTESGGDNKAKQVENTQSNAQGSAKTHEIWLMPHNKPVDVSSAAKQAHAACKPVLLQADPSFLCSSGAMGWPLYPKDKSRFPAEEAVISDFFDRLVLPFQVFPMTGLVEWGSCPYIRYMKQADRWTAPVYRTAWSVDYCVRRNVWNLYARSGDRKYYEYASRFNNHCADWDMAHWTAGNIIRGGFGYAYGLIHEPFHWRGPKVLLDNGNSGHDIANWLFEYYMTGNEHSLEVTREYGDAIKENWNSEKARKSGAQFIILRVLTTLYTREWDPAFRKMADELAAGIIDIDAPHGLSKDLNSSYGPLYKMDRSALALYDYWWATRDERAKQSFIKLMDFIYRFNKIEPPTYYQNAAIYLFTIAYDWTGREKYLRLINFMVQESLRENSQMLADELKGVNNLNSLEKLPSRSVTDNMNYMIGMPSAMSAIAKNDVKVIQPWPMSGRYFERSPNFSGLTCGIQAYFPPRLPPVKDDWAIVFEKPVGKAVNLGVFADEPQPGRETIRITGPDGAPAKAEIKVEERLPYHAACELGQVNTKDGFKPPPLPLHISAMIPANAPGGLYRITSDLVSLVVQDADGTDKISLVCPDGFWLDPYGMPLYFNVPLGLEQLKLFVTQPVTILRPDGTVAIDERDSKVGKISIPVDGKTGAWSIEARFRTRLYAPTPHIRLINVSSIIASMPELLVGVPTKQQSVPASDWTPAAGAFVDGVIGQAVHLTGGKSLTFPFGELLSDGSHANFPSRQGTIEFWFRPDWSSLWLTSKEPDCKFVNAGAVRLGFTNKTLTFMITGLAGGKPCFTGVSSPDYFLRAGEWVHFAAVWGIQDGKEGSAGNFALFIDGHKQPRIPTWLSTLDGKVLFTAGAVTPSVSLGCHNGSIDEFRISNVARYDKDFEPPHKAFIPDMHTAVLFHFDGDSVGMSGDTLKKVEAK